MQTPLLLQELSQVAKNDKKIDAQIKNDKNERKEELMANH